MTKLERMIAELCPNGVEYKKLGEIAAYSVDRINADTINAEQYVGVDNLLSEKKGKRTATYCPTEGRIISYSHGDILIGNIRPYLKKIWLAKDYVG